MVAPKRRRRALALLLLVVVVVGGWASPADAHAELVNTDPVRAGPGHFQAVGTDLDLAGEWELTIRVRPDRFTEQTATITFTVR
ncbi:hypothetical protein BH23ACT2_BH23ACT2_13940 [soil metagenome]